MGFIERHDYEVIAGLVLLALVAVGLVLLPAPFSEWRDIYGTDVG